MAPDGNIWFHPDSPHWRDDYTKSTLGLRALVVHELVHVWQCQQGLYLPLRRPPFARYRYALKPGKPFRRYGIEQQAMIVQHAYVARETGFCDAALAAIIPFGTWAAGAAA